MTGFRFLSSALALSLLLASTARAQGGPAQPAPVATPQVPGCADATCVVVVVPPPPPPTVVPDAPPQYAPAPYAGAAPAYPPNYAAPSPYGTTPQYATPQYAPQYGPAYDPQQLQLELAAIDQRIAYLRSVRPSLGGPIALMATGGGVALFFLVAAAASLDPYSGGASQATRPLLIGSALGAVASVGGLVWLVRRAHARRATNPELKSLMLRRRQILSGFTYGFQSNGREHGASLRFSF